jgi:drug/metabolite transporter (DMT)-like permease
MIDYIVSLPPTTGLSQADFLLARFGFSSLLILPLLWFRRAAVRAILTDCPGRIALMGISSIALYNILQLVGQAEVNPSVAAVVIALEPLLAFVMVWAIGAEKPDRWKLTGLVMAIVGLTIMTTGGAFGKSGAVPGAISMAAMLLSPACWALATVLGKKPTTRHDPLSVAALSMVFGTLPLIPLPWITGGRMATLASQPVEFHLTLAFMVLFPTVLSVLLWYSALRHLSVMGLSIYLFLTPVHGVAISALTREMPGWPVFVGGAVILAGVAITTLLEHPEQEPKKNSSFESS